MYPQERTTLPSGNLHDEDNRVRELDFLWLEVTSKCNLECIHCYADSGPGLPLTQGMSYSKWLGVLNEGFALGCRKLQFIGGEPTLFPPLLQLVRDAKDLGYELVEVFTNGTALTDQMLVTFRDCNVHIGFSFYSFQPEVHDGITRRKGSQGRTIKNIKKALEYGIPVRAAIVEMNENTEDVEAARELLRELGIQSIGTDRMRGIGRANIVLRADDPMGELCGACWRGRLAVDPRGDVFPCVFSRFYKLGNVSQGLDSILQNPELHTFRRKVREIDQHQGPSEMKCRPNCNPCCPTNLICRPF